MTEAAAEAPVVADDGAASAARERAALRNAVERLHAVHTPYRRLEGIRREIVDLLGRDNGHSEGAVHALVGPTRSGKSHLIDDILAAHPRRPRAIRHPNGDHADEATVVYVRVRDTSRKALAEQVYKAISGVPPSLVLGRRYREHDVVDGIRDLAEQCRVRLLILDEAHESIDKKTERATAEIAVLLKEFANFKLFSILVVGTERVLPLLTVEAELASRAPRSHALRPFGASEEDLADWRDILSDIDEHLRHEVFGRRSGLARAPLAGRLREASGGVVGHAATLVREAAYLAVDEWLAARAAGAGDGHVPGVRTEHLARVFPAWTPGWNRPNPFGADEGDLSGLPRNPEGPRSAARGRTRSGSRDAALRK